MKIVLGLILTVVSMLGVFTLGQSLVNEGFTNSDRQVVTSNRVFWPRIENYRAPAIITLDSE